MKIKSLIFFLFADMCQLYFIKNFNIFSSLFLFIYIFPKKNVSEVIYSVKISENILPLKICTTNLNSYNMKNDNDSPTNKYIIKFRLPKNDLINDFMWSPANDKAIYKYKTNVHYDLGQNCFNIIFEYPPLNQNSPFDLIYFYKQKSIMIDHHLFKKLQWLNDLDFELCLSKECEFYNMEKSTIGK